MKSYLRILGHYLKDQKLRTALAVIFLILQVFVLILLQFSYKEIFGGISEKKSFDFIINWIGVIIIALIARTILRIFTDNTMGKLTLTVFNRLRLWFFDHLQWLPAGFYQRVHIGEIVSRYSNDLQQAEVATRESLPLFLRSIFVILFGFITLFYFDWRLALFSACLFPLVVFSSSIFLKQAREATNRNQKAQSKLTSMIEEISRQHLLLQAFNLQESFLKNFKRTLKTYEKDISKGFLFNSVVGESTRFGQTIFEITIFSVGAIMTYRGMMSIGNLFGFFALVWYISGAVAVISNIFSRLLEAGIHMERIEEVLHEVKEVPTTAVKGEKGELFSGLKEDIIFKDLTLQIQEQTILKEINMHIQAGQSVALVGSTGSGKTTIFKLLMRFFPPTEGGIYFDDKEISHFDHESFRSEIGIVFQHNPLFNISILENIRIGKLHATDEEVVRAAKAAEIHEWIISLPDGYQTLIKEYGTNLSGGQSQRIAIARVCLRNPPLLLLDEPTSALDPVIESQINSTLEKLMEGKTVILSTHRIATLHRMDVIFVFEKGKLVEKGSHEALLRLNGYYHRLWEKQHGITLKADGKSPHVKVEYLKNIAIFQGLSDEILHKIAHKFVVEWFDGGEVLFKKGSYGDKFYLIARGAVEIHNPDLPFSKSLIKVLEDGDHFGELALISEQPRMADVMTRSHCIFLTMHAEAFKKILEESPELKEVISKQAQMRLSENEL